MANAIKPKSTTTASKVPAAGDLVTGEIATNLADGVLFLKKADNSIATFEANNGTVESVGMTVPTGLTITGSPITSTGTLAITFTSGYAIPTTSSQATWDTGYSERRQWDGGSTNLNAATARSSLGLVIGSNVQAWDADLDSISGLAGTSGLLKKTAANTWSLDTSAGVPTGSLFPFAGSSAPTGYLLCDGTAVSRTTYATLFGVIGSTYGAGNGSTTFNVPDLRGRMALGAGTGLGLNASGTGTPAGTAQTARTAGQWGGEETHLLTTAEMPAHNHASSNGMLAYVGAGGGANLTTGTTWQNYNLSAVMSNTGGGGRHATVPPFVVLNYLIKT